ncbi:MAG TPA: CesT family type III secretion system chaperone [Rhizobacter sp.]|nr:CesT family type III secretion system chaperone [Rhizobacter sp.]
MDASERLIREFCELLRLGDVESIARGAPLDVNGITCSLTKSRHDEANTVVLYCEFGMVPAGREAAVYQELLVQNFIGSPEGGVVFGFSPVAKHVICMQTLSASAVTARRLGDILHHMAEKAVEWRQTYFLKPAGGASPREGLSAPVTARAVLGLRAGLAPRGLR